MAERTVVRLEGGDELRKALDAVADDALAGRALRRAVGSGANIVRVRARQLAPRRTGTLAQNIDQEADPSSDRKRADVDVGPNQEAWYGLFPEVGTVFAPATPYLRPALDEQEAAVVDEIGDRLRAEILKVTLGRP